MADVLILHHIRFAFQPQFACLADRFLAFVLLQVIDWTTLGFGPESGGYASVFVGWTAFYSVITLGELYLIRC